MDSCLLYTASSVNLSSCHCSSPSCFLPVLAFFYCLSFIPLYLAAAAIYSFPWQGHSIYAKRLKWKRSWSQLLFWCFSFLTCAANSENCWCLLIYPLLWSVYAPKWQLWPVFCFSNQPQASHSSHMYINSMGPSYRPLSSITLSLMFLVLYTVLCHILSYPFMFIPLIYLFFPFFLLTPWSRKDSLQLGSWLYSHAWVLSPIIHWPCEPWVS